MFGWKTTFFEDAQVVASCFTWKTLTIGLPLYGFTAALLKCLELTSLQEEPSYFALFAACELLAALDTLPFAARELEIVHRFGMH